MPPVPGPPSVRNTPLFRAEALTAKSSAMGTMQIRRSGALTLVVSLMSTCAVALLAYLVFGTYGSRTSAVGQLQPSGGLITVQPLVAGTLESMPAQEGQRVKRGEELARVSVDSLAEGGGQVSELVSRSMEERRKAIESTIDAQLAQVDQQEVALFGQIEAARTERARLQDQISTMKQRRVLAARTQERMETVRAKGFLSETQIQQAETEALQLLEGLRALQREDAGMGRNLALLQQQLEEIPTRRQALVAQRQSDLAVLAQQSAEANAQRTRRIESPRDGLITARLAEPGQTVQAGQPLLALLPDDTQMEAHLLVPSRTVGFIEVGDVVRMRYTAYAYQKFGHQTGKVARVSRSAVGTSAPESGGDTLYRVVVALDQQHVSAFGKQEPLLPGMQVEADILLEKRRLIEWVFEPLYALQGRMGN